MEWDLSNYYKTYEDFKNELKNAFSIIDIAKSCKGKLNDEEVFRKYLDLQIDVVGRYEKLYLYANCVMDKDRRNTKALSDMQEVMHLFQEYSEATSFQDSEILSLGEEYVFNTIKKYEELGQFEYYLKDLFRSKEHSSSEAEQRIIANYSPLSGSGRDLYASLTNGDYKEYKITLNDGSIVDVNGSNWTKLVSDSKDPLERKRIFEAEFKRYADYKNTYASIYSAVLKADIALAKSKGFDSALDMHLYWNNIPTSLYHNLINIAHEAAPSVKKYYELKRKEFGLDKIHTYDRFLDLRVDESNKTYSYDEARELFYKSIEKFDDEFKEFAHEATKDGYVDVMPSPGKRGGAYSNSTANTHPCILLNFNGTLDSCFTLAHEAGHSTHSLFSNKYQPTMTQGYVIFVAEIASTFNEHNLLDYLLNSGTLTKNEKIRLIQNALDGILSTFYRQTLFAEYEYLAHTMAEKGEPVTEESLSNIMIKLYDEYYGIDINDEVYKKYVWAYIPHFFNSPYYVYQYATSYSASLAIYDKVKSNEKDAFKNYLSLLKSGGSDYPIELVKLAGVDFTKPDCLKGVIKRFDELYSALEELLNE